MTNVRALIMLVGVSCLPATVLLAADAPVTPAEAMDSTKGQSNICEVHHVAMSKRTVPFAHGMIPLSRAEAERGEWKRRTDNYPHPGDCQPATDIVLPGEMGRCVVYVCPKCAAAKNDMERANAAATPERLLRAIDAVVLAKIENELARWEKAAKEEALADGVPPSSQTAYYLLSGLAGQGVPLEGLREDEQRQFDVERRGGRSVKLVSVFTDVRVALIDYAIQDKSATHILKTAQLYVHQDGNWSKKGNAGRITSVAAVNHTVVEEQQPSDTVRPSQKMSQVRTEFERLLPLWQEERKQFGPSSNTHDYWEGPNGKAIIALGPAVIPYLIQQVKAGDFFFNVPLALITKVDIANGKYQSEQADSKLWVEWWKAAKNPPTE